MEYFVIGDDDTVLGFSVVGVAGISVKSADEASRAWTKALEDKIYGIIIITEEAADLIRDTVDRYLFSETFPLVVEIPGSEKRKGKDLRELVNDAIGVSI